MINVIFFFISFLIGGGLVIFIINDDIKKKGYTDMVKGMYLQPFNPNEIEPMTRDRAILMFIEIKELYPEVSIDKILEIWKKEGYIKDEIY